MKKIEPPTPGSTWIHTRCQRAVKILRVLPAVLDKRLSYVEYYYPRTSGRGPGGFHRTKCPAQQLPLRAFLTLFTPKPEKPLPGIPFSKPTFDGQES